MARPDPQSTRGMGGQMHRVCVVAGGSCPSSLSRVVLLPVTMARPHLQKHRGSGWASPMESV
eukprot:10650950-Prorocentrum_lima.AAC.1